MIPATPSLEDIRASADPVYQARVDLAKCAEVFAALADPEHSLHEAVTHFDREAWALLRKETLGVLANLDRH